VIGYSRRLPWSSPENALSRALRERREPPIDLTESNPTRAGLVPPVHLGALADSRALRYEPHPKGLLAAREAVAAYYAESRGAAVDPENILLTASTSEAYALLFKMLADPGDVVLVPRPSYPLFEFLAGLESLRVEPYPLPLDDRFRLDPEAIERVLSAPRQGTVRAVVIVSPNNPTGTGVRAAERDAIEAIAERHRVAIVSDEVFRDPAREGAPPDLVSLAGRRAAGEPPALAFTLGGLSKACGLPQMKLAWILVDGPEPLRRDALERLEFIADTYLSVGTPVQRAAARLLEEGEMVGAAIRRRVAANLALLRALLPAGAACRLLPSDGGWSAVLQVPAVGAEEEMILALLEKDGVLVHPGYFFDFPREAFLVLSLLPEEQAFRDGVGKVLARVG